MTPWRRIADTELPNPRNLVNLLSTHYLHFLPQNSFSLQASKFNNYYLGNVNDQLAFIAGNTKGTELAISFQTGSS